MDSKITIDFYNTRQKGARWHEVTETLITIEYLYLLTSIAYVIAEVDFEGGENVKEAFIKSIEFATEILRFNEQPGRYYSAINVFRSYPIFAYFEELQMHAIQMNSPMRIEFGGFARAIKVIWEIFDPTMRARREEELRHLRESNRFNEEKARMDVLRDKVKTFKSVDKLRKELQGNAKLEIHRKDSIIAAIEEEIVNVLFTLENQGIEIRSSDHPDPTDDRE